MKSLLRREAFCVRIIYKNVFQNLTILSILLRMSPVSCKKPISQTPINVPATKITNTNYWSKCSLIVPASLRVLD